MGDEERWRRHDWWGVVLEAPDHREVGHFYAALRGWSVFREDDSDCVLDAGEGVAYLTVQRAADGYEPPTWPPVPGRPGMLHLDFEVVDLESEVARAVALGARVAEHQPQDDVRVLLDPAGHPFCLYT